MCVACSLATFTAVPAQGQLNENCTISILNRTAQVRPDGSWRIDNVPANFGAVRARATCVEGGVTQSGQSSLFEVQAGIINGFDAEIVLGAADPIPTALAVTAPLSTLTSAGATTQLGVTASFPDGSTADVSAAANGTNYTVSNAGVATVGSDGLVTAVMSGTATLTAMNEGVIGFIQVQVVLSGDSDGDGIPDDLELANGLDPDDPIDGLEDPDRDGLTNKEELVDFGTDFQVADTDGDTILDGEEVVPGDDGFVTSPVLADTDGDGIRDALEIATGSDPTDSSSFNLALALDSLSVSPSTFVLTVNTIIGEASRQLAVTGLLLDGTTIDLTSTSNYLSSDPGICNFGAPAGRVFAGADGSCTITVDNNGFSTVADGSVTSFAPIARSFIGIPGYANNVDVNDDFAYVAAGASGLQIVDVADPDNPVIAGWVDTPGNANDVRVMGSFAYLADGEAGGLQVIDVSDPTAPVVVGSADTPGEAQDVVLSGMLAYVADGAVGGLQVIDVSDPAAPSVLGGVVTPGTARGVDVSGNLAIVADDMPDSAARVIDVSDPANPTILGSVAVPGAPKDLVARNDKAYVIAFDGGFHIVDFSDPANPLIVGSLSEEIFIGRDVALFGDFALAAEQLFPNAVPIVDVEDPTDPLLLANLDFFETDNYAGTGIAVTPQFVYMTGELGTGAEDNGSLGNTRLFIGQYLSREDNEGIAPTVSITSPAPGSTVIEGATLLIVAEASDDIEVASVEFLIDGQSAFTDTSAPFEFAASVPPGVTSLTLGAVAFDLGGNIGTAPEIVLNVTSDLLTTAEGQVVGVDGLALPGADVDCFGVTGTTISDGTFSIPGVPTASGDTQCRATFVEADGDTLIGGSAAVTPVLGGVTVVGQIVASRVWGGTDFWLAFQLQTLNDDGAQLIILSDTTTDYSVTGPGGFDRIGSVSSDSPATVAIPNSLQIDTTEIVEDKGLHVVSDEAISILFYYPNSLSQDIYLGIPTRSLGTDYLVVGYQESISARGFNAELGPSEFVIVASEDNTNITIIPSCTGLSGTPAGSTINLMLNQGQTYQYLCGYQTDVTGTQITSDRPIGVVAGNACADVPATYGGCDILSEMLLPTSLYSTDFFTVPLPNGADDIIRIMAAADNTTVTVDDGFAQTDFDLNRGEFEEISTGVATHITSDQPVLIVQYAVGWDMVNVDPIGDPFEMQIMPTVAGLRSTRLFSPEMGQDGVTLTYATIVAPNSAVSSVTLNDQAVTGFTPLPGGTHQSVVATVPLRQSVVTASEPVLVYGIGFRFGEAYGYPAGF